MRYLVTTDISCIPTDHQIIMVDGTVPGWIPRPHDLHWDHHRPQGADIQIDEMPMPKDSLIEDFATEYPPCLVTPQVDADACCAAAWVQLQRDVLSSQEIVDKLRAIAWDCDHLMVPEELSYLAEFAFKVVAGLRTVGADICAELQLPLDRNAWSMVDWQHYMSEAFQRSTEWLMAAAKGNCTWPGEQGEADGYLQSLKTDAQNLIKEGRIQFIPTSGGDVAVCNLKEIGRYVDPRAFHQAIGILVDDIKKLRPETLVIREHKYGGTQYTLGCLPGHPQTRNLDFTAGVFASLTKAERLKDAHVEGWGGRRTVGGSGWNTASVLTPEEVVQILG
ncbi:MAG: hypothetical protein QNJ47_18740 [Nostocaceae cyanobacterium]|nr:hypothetical protein [Nostocaceae cyanobacterium]